MMNNLKPNMGKARMEASRRMPKPKAAGIKKAPTNPMVKEAMKGMNTSPAAVMKVKVVKAPKKAY